MSTTKKIKSALVSVFHKDGLEPLVKQLNDLGVTLYSTGGTEKFIRDLGIEGLSFEIKRQACPLLQSFKNSFMGCITCGVDDTVDEYLVTGSETINGFFVKRRYNGDVLRH